jgi:hypothetical protein
MLERLPLAVLEDISLRAGQPTVLAQTCTGLWRAMHDPAVQLRLYMGMQRRATRHEASSASSCGSGSATLPSGRLGRISSDTVASSSSSDGADAESSGEPAAVCGPDTVFGLLVCKATTSDPHATLRLLQLLLACSNMVGLVPPHAQQALQQAIAATEPAAAPGALQLLQSVLPYAEHCLLPFAAGGGHLGLVRLLLRLTSTPVRLHGCLHYVRTSAFLAAASGGHAGVLSELLAAGAAHWACQLPGSSLTQTALDAAALGGHVPAMQLLAHYCRNPGPLFLTAAADSGSSDAMQFALEHWFAQANALTAYSRAHTLQLHEALRCVCVWRGVLAYVVVGWQRQHGRARTCRSRRHTPSTHVFAGLRAHACACNPAGSAASAATRRACASCWPRCTAPTAWTAACSRSHTRAAAAAQTRWARCWTAHSWRCSCPGAACV